MGDFRVERIRGVDVEILNNTGFMCSPQISGIDHPLVQNYLATVRNSKTDMNSLRRSIGKIAELLFYEASRGEVITKEVEIMTPVTETHVQQIEFGKYSLVTAFRAGILMTDAIVDGLGIPVSIGIVDMHRNESDLMRPHVFNRAIPEDIHEREIMVCDPMLATGGSGAALLHLLVEEHHCNPEKIKFLCLIAAPQGIELLRTRFPEVKIYTSAIDKGLTCKEKYIFPGAGDIGDLGFGTNYNIEVLNEYLSGELSAG